MWCNWTCGRSHRHFLTHFEINFRLSVNSSALEQKMPKAKHMRSQNESSQCMKNQSSHKNVLDSQSNEQWWCGTYKWAQMHKTVWQITKHSKTFLAWKIVSKVETKHLSAIQKWENFEQTAKALWKAHNTSEIGQIRCDLNGSMWAKMHKLFPHPIVSEAILKLVKVLCTVSGIFPSSESSYAMPVTTCHIFPHKAKSDCAQLFLNVLKFLVIFTQLNSSNFSQANKSWESVKGWLSWLHWKECSCSGHWCFTQQRNGWTDFLRGWNKWEFGGTSSAGLNCVSWFHLNGFVTQLWPFEKCVKNHLSTCLCSSILKPKQTECWAHLICMLLDQDTTNRKMVTWLSLMNEPLMRKFLFLIVTACTWHSQLLLKFHGQKTFCWVFQIPHWSCWQKWEVSFARAIFLGVGVGWVCGGGSIFSVPALSTSIWHFLTQFSIHWALSQIAKHFWCFWQKDFASSLLMSHVWPLHSHPMMAENSTFSIQAQLNFDHFSLTHCWPRSHRFWVFAQIFWSTCQFKNLFSEKQLHKLLRRPIATFGLSKSHCSATIHGHMRQAVFSPPWLNAGLEDAWNCVAFVSCKSFKKAHSQSVFPLHPVPKHAATGKSHATNPLSGHCGTHCHLSY